MLLLCVYINLAAADKIKINPKLLSIFNALMIFFAMIAVEQIAFGGGRLSILKYRQSKNQRKRKLERKQTEKESWP